MEKGGGHAIYVEKEGQRNVVECRKKKKRKKN